MTTGTKKTLPIRPYWIMHVTASTARTSRIPSTKRPPNGLRVAIEVTFLAQTPIEIVLHPRQHRVELLLKIAQGDAAFAAEDLVVQPLLEVLEPLRLPQLDEPVVAARGGPGVANSTSSIFK